MGTRKRPEGFWNLIEHATGDFNPNRNLELVPTKKDSKYGQLYTVADTNPLPRIELFCRGEPRSNWDGWGYQCEGKRKVELDLL